MLTLLPKKFPIQPIIDQVNSIDNLTKRLDLNRPSGKFFNHPWIIKDEFIDTPLGNVLNSLGNIGQARLLSLESSESYTAHTDPDDRIHLAIITNSYSFLIDLDENKMYHVPADGTLWHMDTSHLHVASNWGARKRVHLNVRLLLPEYDKSKKSLRIKVVSGDFDWKQNTYAPLMTQINRYIKLKLITGFEAVSDKELLLNVNDNKILDNVLEQISLHGVSLEVDYQ